MNKPSLCWLVFQYLDNVGLGLHGLPLGLSHYGPTQWEMTLSLAPKSVRIYVSKKKKIRQDLDNQVSRPIRSDWAFVGNGFPNVCRFVVIHEFAQRKILMDSKSKPFMVKIFCHSVSCLYGSLGLIFCLFITSAASKSSILYSIYLLLPLYITCVFCFSRRSGDMA